MHLPLDTGSNYFPTLQTNQKLTTKKHVANALQRTAHRELFWRTKKRRAALSPLS